LTFIYAPDRVPFVVELEGIYKCARTGVEVSVGHPLPEQTEAQFATEVHTSAESVQYACNQGDLRSCSQDCEIKKLIEKTVNITLPHRHPRD
jgi:hypothetical protein